jgi:hypothetical protein
MWLGFAALVYCLFQFATLLILDPFGAGFYYVEPIWYFRVLGVDHHIPWLTPVAFAAMVAACVCVSRGTRTRLSIALLLLTIVYLKGVRDSIAGDVHHRMLIPTHMLIFLLLSRSGDVLSADARRKPPAAPLEEWEASWPINAMQAYLVLFYFFGAVAKLRVSGFVWFGGGRIHDLLISRSLGFAHDVSEWSFRALAFEMAQIPAICALLGLLTLAFEAGFPLLFFSRNVVLRVLVLLGATVFHIANFVLAGVQFLLMPLMFAVFFDLAAVRARFRSRRGPSQKVGR